MKMKKNCGRYVGTTEDRINKWMRMCLQWQFDIRRGIEKKPNHYFTKYHVGKYARIFFSDLADSVIDRAYVINKMNIISEARLKRDKRLGLRRHKVVLKQTNLPIKKLGCKSSGIKINDDTIVKYVGKGTYDLTEVSTASLLEELASRTTYEA